jgi:hypothetical protein
MIINYVMTVLAGISLLLFLFLNPTINIKAIFFIAFTKGLFVLVGVPDQFLKLTLEISVVALFANTLLRTLKTKSKFSTPGIGIFSIYTIIVLLSFISNDSSLLDSILFYRHLLVPYLLFLGVINSNLRESKRNSINKLVVSLFILQIISSVIKIMVVGMQQEDIIGTISYSQGALATIFPLFSIGLVISLLLFHKRKPFVVYVLLVIGFLLVGLASAKRAVWMYTPLLMICIYCLYVVLNRNLSISKLIKNIGVVSIVFAVSLYMGGTLIPTLNPDNMVGGRFDLSYMIGYAGEYSNRVTADGMTFGRQNTTTFVIDTVLSDVYSAMFGYGPDAINRGDDALTRANRFGIRYGLTGMTFNMISIGFLGALIIPLFFVFFGIRAKYVFKLTSSRLEKALSFSCITSTVVFFIDYVTYSGSFLYGEAISITHFYLLALVISRSTSKPVSQMIIEERTSA